MRKTAAIFLVLCGVCFAAEEPTNVRMNDLKVILEKTFLSAQSEPLLNMMAAEAANESEKKIDSQELVSKFRNAFHEEKNLAKFCEPYQTIFSDSEVQELRKIHENPTWEKYSQQGMQIFQANFQSLKESFKELALATTTEAEAEEVADNAELEEIAANGNIIDVTKDNFNQTVAGSSLPMIIDVNATWCNPCRMMEPIIDELSGEYSGQIQFAKVDYDSQPELVKKFGVSSLPTILFVKAGQKTASMKHVGFMSKEDFEAKIKQFLKK
jgi:thioredoxin 1